MQKGHYLCPVNLTKTYTMEKVEIVLIPGIQASTAKKGAIPTKGYAKEQRMSVLYNKVKHYLDEEKVFLNPDLSLAKFSIIVVPTIILNLIFPYQTSR